MGLFSFMFGLLFFFVRGTFAVVYSIRLLESISDRGSTLVSLDGSFEMGFFSPSSSKNRYLGIWYKNIPIQTVVWVANRCNPINDSSGLLTISETGNLMLLCKNKGVVWSAGSMKQAQKPLVQLFDNGNLVLRDENDENSENYLWQSFDYPSDTFLPGMKMGWDLRRNLMRRLTAWKSFDDPCDGDLTYGIEIGENPRAYSEAIIQKGSRIVYRSGPWNGLMFNGGPDLRSNSLFNFSFVENDDEVYYTYNIEDKSVISMQVINQTTSLSQRLIWFENERIWLPTLTVPIDQCDNYNLCGANGICKRGETPICQCLDGFKPMSKENWNKMDWSEGCVRITPMNFHDKDNDTFVKFSHLKLPCTEHTWVNMSMNLEECRAKCLSNYSCMAYTNADIRGQGSGCLLWFGNLLDIRKFPPGTGQDLYIRMSAAGTEKLIDGLMKSLVASLVALTIYGITCVVLSVFFERFSNGKNGKERNETKTTNEDRIEDPELPLFGLPIISTATNNFSESNKLGEGGFGPVYRGMLEEGQEIAVKKLSIYYGQGINEFKNEVKQISKLQHQTLVKLLGCCIHGEEKLLVYEYIPNKTLESVIFDQKQGKLLEWPERFQILWGIAQGLLYLHHDSRLRIVHRNLKASNVLLDQYMNPKISDFGLAKTLGGYQIEGNTNRVVGLCSGYMAPEYALHGLFSIKSDVFSFGILMLEILTGKTSQGLYGQNQDLNLIGHAWTMVKEDKAFELIDEELRDSFENVQEALRCLHVGLLCVQESPIDRPDMSSVVLMLSGESVLPHPKPPRYLMEANKWEADDYSFFNCHLSFLTCDTNISVVVDR